MEDYKKKYEEALKKAKGIYIDATKEHCTHTDWLENIFPELKESEDEKIRKAIIEHINCKNKELHIDSNDSVTVADAIAWLEKQDEKKPVISDDALREGISHFGITQYQIDNWLKKYVDVEKQGEKNPYSGTSFEYNGHIWGMCARDGGVDIICDKQFIKHITFIVKQGEKKSADKVEPKFKIEKGKWYVCIKDLLDNYANTAFCEGDTYLSTQDGSLIPSNSNVPFEVVCPNVYFRDWTIQDAKDGDILVNKCGAIFINAGNNGEHRVTLDCHCYISVQGDFCLEENKTGSWLYKTEIHPATKEQRDLLFQKMKEAGYKWDAEKKELNKIEQKPAWSEEDEQFLLVCKNALAKYQTTDKWDASIISRWLENRIKCGSRVMHAWSEEDEKLYTSALWHIKNSCGNGGKDSGEFEVYNWLKSLKDRIQPQLHWKPSEEQMQALFEAKLASIRNREYFLGLLYEDLKKL